MTIKEILIEYSDKTGVWPPFNTKKIEKAGLNPTSFLLGLKERLERADDLKTSKSRKTLNAFFRACERLM